MISSSASKWILSVFIAGLLSTLVSCGDKSTTDTGDSEPNSTNSNSSSNKDTDTLTYDDGNPNTKDDHNERDGPVNCVINKIELSPKSGATINVNNGERLSVSIDYTLKADVGERVHFYGFLFRVDQDDLGEDSSSGFTGSGKAGRYSKQFTINFKDQYYSNGTNKYTTLRIGHWPDSGCVDIYKVNYILIKNR